jgi:hypothetical protein
LLVSGDRGSSDFDVRHAFTAGFSYESAGTRSRLLRNWAIDGMFRARTGFPINVLNADQFMGVSFENVFRPDLVPASRCGSLTHPRPAVAASTLAHFYRVAVRSKAIWAETRWLDSECRSWIWRCAASFPSEKNGRYSSALMLSTP